MATRKLKLRLRLRVCLFGGEIGWIENFGEKIKEKMGLCTIWLGGGKENFCVRPRHFPPVPTQNFSLQNGEKKGEKSLRHTVVQN